MDLRGFFAPSGCNGQCTGHGVQFQGFDHGGVCTKMLQCSWYMIKNSYFSSQGEVPMVRAWSRHFFQFAIVEHVLNIGIQLHAPFRNVSCKMRNRKHLQKIGDFSTFHMEMSWLNSLYANICFMLTTLDVFHHERSPLNMESEKAERISRTLLVSQLDKFPLNLLDANI